jgi:hypothetical protein
MNKDRRKQIAGVDSLIGRIREMLEEAKSEAESARDDERDYFDNMPESLQGGEKGERASAAADALDELVSALEEADSALENASGYIETAGE